MKTTKLLTWALSLVCSLTAAAQPFAEKVYLHTDRSHYAPGDDLWYKAYLVNASTHKLSDHSATLYVELISPNAQISSREVVHLNEGTGKGDFRLNDTLAPGRYRLRAYTAYMLNYDSTFLFEKEINVISLLKETTPLPKRSTTSLPQISFFPEGGALVQGIKCTVAFKATDANGNGCAAIGSIANADGHEVATFASSHLGMGSFVFTPATGQTYVANGMAGEKTFSTTLRAALTEGFVLHAQAVDSAIALHIATNAKTFEENEDDEFTVITECRGKIFLKKTFELRDTVTNLQFPTEYLPAGILKITLLDKLQRPYCERLVYISHREEVKVTVSQVLHPDSVELRLQTTDAQNRPLPANLSLAVTDAGVVPQASSSIFSYLTLESDLRGKIENPLSYFDTTNAQRFNQLDLLMLTQGWRNFIWKQKLDSIFHPRYEPEQGLIVRGKVKHLLNKKPYPDANVSMMLMGAKGGGIGGQRTDSAGLFRFPPVEFYGAKRLILSAKDDKGKPVGEILTDSMYLRNIYAPRISSLLNLSDTSVKKLVFILDSFKLKYKRKYHLSDTILLKPVTVGNSEKHSNANYNFTILAKDSVYNDYISYLMDNTSFFCPMTVKHRVGECWEYIEVLATSFNTVPAIYVNGRLVSSSGKITYDEKDINKKLSSSSSSLNSDSEDGIPTYHGKIFTYNLPHNIDMIDVKSIKTTASAVYITATWNPLDNKRDYQSINRKFNGYYQAREFYAPLKPGDNNTRKQLTLYWNPEVITQPKTASIVKYARPKENTNTRIEVEGVTKGGMAVAQSILMKSEN